MGCRWVFDAAAHPTFPYGRMGVTAKRGKKMTSLICSGKPRDNVKESYELHLIIVRAT